MAKLWLPSGQHAEVQAIGLDLDGVVRDSACASYEALCQVIETFGGTPPPHAVWIAKEFDNVAFCRAHGADVEKDTLDQAYFEIQQDHVHGPFADVAEFCAEMRAHGLDLFVVSACREDWVHPWFTRHQLDVYFERIVALAKQKAPHLQTLCRELSLDSNEVCYVADMGHDMRAATEAGVIPIGVTRGLHSAKEPLQRCGARLVVEHLADLAALVT